MVQFMRYSIEELIQDGFFVD